MVDKPELPKAVTDALEKLDESQSKELAALSTQRYRDITQEKKEKTKAWRELYKLVRETSVDLNKKVAADEIEVDEAITQMKSAVEDFEVSSDEEEEETEEESEEDE